MFEQNLESNEDKYDSTDELRSAPALRAESASGFDSEGTETECDQSDKSGGSQDIHIQ